MINCQKKLKHLAEYDKKDSKKLTQEILCGDY